MRVQLSFQTFFARAFAIPDCSRKKIGEKREGQGEREGWSWRSRRHRVNSIATRKRKIEVECCKGCRCHTIDSIF